MPELFSWVFGYDSSRRSISPLVYHNVPPKIDTFKELAGFLENVPLADMGITERQLCREVIELLRQRLIATLLPEEAMFGDPTEVKPIIRDHISNYSLDGDGHLVSAIKFFADNFRNKARKNKRKSSIEDVRVYYPSTFAKILKSQSERCAVCGAPLIYGDNIELDHLIPWHLGDDPSDGGNWRFLCGECNLGKHQWLHYTAIFGRVASLYAEVTNALTKAVRYAALTRDLACAGCGAKPTEASLTVRRRTNSGCWVLDNVLSYCPKC
jgi:5-methylcytosine-specific restriction endonuclease McrA